VERFDVYPELCGKIREKYRTQGAFARAIGMNPSTLSGKLAGKRQWTYLDVEKSCRALGIPMADAPNFFRPNVARLQH
jgi:hypothetical protein